MYVWTTGFDATVSGCDEAKLVAWDETTDPECYTHTWDTAARRQWLWDTANRPGREIRRLFISGTKTLLQAGYAGGDCGHADVQRVREMLADGHCKVPGVALHALFSDSDAAVSEQNWIPYVAWYNDTCASGPAERFDGVAINNEAWKDIECTGSPAAEQAYLDDLQAIVDLAQTPLTGPLATHYSIGWHWSDCSGVETPVTWNGVTKPPTHHMIDVFDSVDVQVAHVSANTAAARAQTAGYAYALGLGKPFYLTSYTNKADAASCTATHFPYFCSFTWSNTRRSDDYLMNEIFDAYVANGVPDAIPSIHYFRGVYSTGAQPQWPSYASGSVDACSP
jgi:hypothetical protein